MSERKIGTTARGVRCSIIREGDNLRKIIVDSILDAAQSEGFSLRDRDVVAVTESVVARAQGNYASVDDIAADVIDKFGKDQTIGIVFPILSRNRFAMCLKGFARAAKKVVILLSYPSDEVGNSLFAEEKLFSLDINPYSRSIMSEKEYRELFGENKHTFTGVDYVSYYSEIVKAEGADVDFIFSNHPEVILQKTENVILCDIHTVGATRHNISKFLTPSTKLYTMSDILSKESKEHGYNERYGLLGSNKADEDRVKLFPRDSRELVEGVKSDLKSATGKNIEVMVYGDGAFKDPVGGIWEFADPVVSPNFTTGLLGTPNELKLKYLADNDYRGLSGDELRKAITNEITNKNSNLKGTMGTEGTTPRQLTDLIGSLCDLMSGSGDKGTPIVLIQGYFDNYSNN